MRFLVTGVGGFIGGSLAETLVTGGHEVIATYRKTLPRLTGASERMRLVAMDLAESWPSVDPVDVVIHAAAQTHLIPDATAWDYVRSNILGTLNLLRYVKAVRPRLIVMLSTLSVYGEVLASRLEEETWLNRPELYGATKYVAELAMREAASTLPVLCVRLPGVVGKGYFTPWLGGLVCAASRHQGVRIYNPQAPFNNVVDLVELKRFIMHVVGRGLSGWEVVNLAAAEPMSIRSVAELVVSLTGSHSSIVEEMPRSARTSFVISIERLKKRLLFHPASTRAIIHRYVAENLEVLRAFPQDPNVAEAVGARKPGTGVDDDGTTFVPRHPLREG